MRIGGSIFIALIMLFMGSPLSGEVKPYSGELFLQNCLESTTEAPTDPAGAGFCLGLLYGYSEGRAIGQLFPNLPPDCTHREVTPGQKAHIIIKYLQDHPEHLPSPAALIVAKALTNAYPCSTQTTPR